jgi:universal stress protein A
MEREIPEQLSRILVPVDFSEQSLAALRYATFLAAPFHAKVDVLHVWEVPHFVGMDLMLQMPNVDSEPLEQYVRDQVAQEMNDFLAAGQLREHVQVTQRLEAGDVDSVILQVAKAERYDLIVMGTHGRTGLAHLLMGSVAENVVRHAPCPVLTVRHPGAAERDTRSVAAEGQEIHPT